MSATIDADAIELELARTREVQLSREDVNDVVHGLGEIIGIEDLALDEQGVVELIIDDDVELSLIHLSNLPGIVAAAPMPEGTERNPRVLRKVLQTNMSWATTQGGSFVFVPPRLALCRLVPLSSRDSSRLDRELAMFVDLVGAWKREVLSCMSDADRDEPGCGDLDESFVGMKV